MDWGTHAAVLAAMMGCAGAMTGCSSNGEGPADSTTGGAGSGTGGTTTTTTGSGGSGASTGSGGGGSGPVFTGSTRVDSGAGNAVDRSADLMVAPDGTVYVSWVDGSEDVHVARSTDGGQSFEADLTLDDASIAPIVSVARHPRLAADDARVAVAFGDQAGTLYLYVSNAGALDFGQPILLGGDINTTFRDFPKPIMLANGSIGVAYQGYPQTGARIYFARETASYLSEVASAGVPGVPCECCPLEAVLDANDDLMLAFRNNDNNLREMWFAEAPGGAAFSSWAEASTTEGQIPACPMQGPRMVQTGTNDQAMVWSARGNNNPGAAIISYSTDGGASWSGGAPIPGFVADEPTVALGPSGKLYVAGVTGNKQSAMLVRDAAGTGYTTPAPLTVADGTLSTPQALGRGGVAALAGVSSGATVWFLRME